MKITDSAQQSHAEAMNVKLNNVLHAAEALRTATAGEGIISVHATSGACDVQVPHEWFNREIAPIPDDGWEPHGDPADGWLTHRRTFNGVTFQVLRAPAHS